MEPGVVAPAVSVHSAVAGRPGPAVGGWAALPSVPTGMRTRARRDNPRRKDRGTGSPIGNSHRDNSIRTTGRRSQPRPARSIAADEVSSRLPRLREIRPAFFEKGANTLDEFFGRSAGREAFGLAPQLGVKSIPQCRLKQRLGTSIGVCRAVR